MFITKGVRESGSDAPTKANPSAAYNVYVKNRKISSPQCLQNMWLLEVRER